MLQATWRERTLASLLLVALVVIAFWTAVTEVYGATDDFDFYAKVLLDGRRCRDILLPEGRLLLGIIYDTVALVVDSFEDTRLFRVIFVVGACGSAVALCQIAVPRLGLFAGGAVAGLFVMSPAVLDLAALQPSAACTVGSALALVGFLAFSAARRHDQRRARLALRVVALCALAVSAAIYQTASFVWFIGVAVELVAPNLPGGPPDQRPLMRTAAATGFFAASMAAYAAVFLVLLPHLLGGGTARRVELTTSLTAKGAWFMFLPLRDALVGPYFSVADPQAAMLSPLHRGEVPAELLWNAITDPSTWAALGVLIGIIVGLWSRAGGTPRHRLQVVTLGLALLPLSYGANLAIGEMWSSFRTQLALGGVVAVFLVVAVEQLLVRITSPAVTRVALCGLVAAAFLLTAAQQRAWTSGPLGCEWQTTRAEVAAASSATALVVVPMRAVDTTAPGLRYDLGWPASAKWWGPVPMVRVARQSLALPDIPIEVTTREQLPATLPAGAMVLWLGCRP